MTLPDPDRGEALSIAYVSAIAAIAGINFDRLQKDLGIDGMFTKVSRIKNHITNMPGTPIFCQIKSALSSTCKTEGNNISYNLNAKNYNDLVHSDLGVLILMCLPPSTDDALKQDEECLCLHKCCYY